MLRLGWEFNGPWYPWSLSSTNSADSPREFIAYWQHIVTLMRAIAPGLQFDWNVYNGAGAVEATEGPTPGTPTSMTSAWTYTTRVVECRRRPPGGSRSSPSRTG